MKQCDFCSQPAVVHETTVKNGIKREIHLCEHHAKQAGIGLPVDQPVSELLTQFMVSKTPRPTRKAKPTCPSCGMTYSEFRHAGVVGCPDCYTAFEKQLAPLIERAQNGAIHHAGKTPQRAGGSLDRQLLIKRLARELDAAVAAEQYEKAAELRDRLHHIQLDPARGEADVD